MPNAAAPWHSLLALLALLAKDGWPTDGPGSYAAADASQHSR